MYVPAGKDQAAGGRGSGQLPLARPCLFPQLVELWLSPGLIFL